MLKIGLWVILALFSGLLYRLGGIGKPYPTKLRDCGCAACLVACLWLWGIKLTLLSGLLTFCLSWAALSSYWKGKATDMKWWNWALHGLGCGLAALPLVLTNIPLVNILCRVTFCAVTMTAVSEVSDSVWYEEFWRGFIVTASAVFLI